MTDKERLECYVDRLGRLGDCLANFFATECPDAPPGAVRPLLAAYRDINTDLAALAAELPNE